MLDGFVSRPVRCLWMPRDPKMEIPSEKAIHTFLTHGKCEAVNQLSPGKGLVTLTHRQGWQEGLVADENLRPYCIKRGDKTAIVRIWTVCLQGVRGPS